MEFNATLIGEMIAFAFLIWFCVHFIWPHLSKAIEERQLKIAEGLSAAEQAHVQLQEADAKVAAEVLKAQQQAVEIIDKAQQQARHILDQAHVQAQIQTKRQQALARDEIRAMEQQSLEALKSRIGKLVVQGASKVVQREIDLATHHALLDQIVSEI